MEKKSLKKKTFQGSVGDVLRKKHTQFQADLSKNDTEESGDEGIFLILEGKLGYFLKKKKHCKVP